ncbi:MAG: SpoIIE family protein phosphatase [Leptonema sp. (in: bacteria)]
MNVLKTESPQDVLIQAEVEEKESIFSANEIGKVTLNIKKLKEITNFDYSDLPNENDTPLKIYNIYQNHPNLDFLPIRNHDNWIVGYFTRKSFLSLISEQNYNRELLFRKDVKIKNYFNQEIVCLNAFTTLSKASEILTSRKPEILYDPFVVTLNRKFFGIATLDRIIKGMNTFIKRDLETVKESQLNVMNYLDSHNRKIENELEFSSYINLVYGPGGDFVQKYEINEQSTIISHFDVCGKGVKASSMILVLGALLNQMILRLKKGNLTIPILHKEIRNFNHDLYYSKAMELYATGIIALVNKIDRILTLYDFGHNLLWILRDKKVSKRKVYKVEPAQKNLTFLGAFPEIHIKPVSLQLQKEDIIFTCSDGITEQMNDRNEMYINFISNALENFTSDVNHNSKLLLSHWNEFRNNRIIRDDISFSVAKIN